MKLQELTRKINDLVRHNQIDKDPTLEDVFVVFSLSDYFIYDFEAVDKIVYFRIGLHGKTIEWQLTKPLSQQSKETIETITKILE